MSGEPQCLSIYKTGPMTVVGFGGREILDQVNIVSCRAEVVQLVEQHHIEVLAFDLTGVRLIPSGLLGLLASLRNLGVKVQLCNPSDDVLEVLQITHLDRVLEVLHVPVA